MKCKYVLILSILILVFLSGCLNSSVLPQTKQISPEPTFEVIQVAPTPEPSTDVNQRSSMGWKEFYDTIIYSRDLTDLQKENLYVNKIFTWTGQVKEVTQDMVNIQNEYCNGEGINRLCRPIYVNLHVDDDQKPKLISLSKGSKISFEGTITKLNLWFDNIDMYNGKISGAPLDKVVVTVDGGTVNCVYDGIAAYCK
jgi:hypothetical protein